MHKEYQYQSVFAEQITDYISSRRESGFMFDNPAYWLYRFDQFCCRTAIEEHSISKKLFDAWAFKSKTESKTTQNNRLEALRNFSVYLNTLGISSYVPSNLPRPEKTIPYLMTDQDIVDYFQQVDLYDTSTSVAAFRRMAQEYKVLFRIIYCCGLRNNEACSLKTENVDVSDGSIMIYHSKGNKDRIVYLSEDLRILCIDYLGWLQNQLGFLPKWFFPGKDPMVHIPKTSVDGKFNEFWNATASSKSCDKKPTVHCLRHAYVIKRMNSWMNQNISLNVMMPYLSNYLGHKGPMETYYYYHQVEDAFRIIKCRNSVSSRVIPEVQYEE